MNTAFTRAEYLERLRKTKARMDAAGLDLLLVADPANMYYLSGYNAISYYVPQFLIVAPEEEEPIWVGRYMDAACALYTVFMSEASIIGYPEHFIGDPNRHATEFVADLLRERGWDNRRIGLEYESHGLTHGTARQLERRLPNATFHDADFLVNWVRTVKSDQEVEYIRQAGIISDLGIRTAIEVIQPGVRQNVAAAAILEALNRGTDEYPGDLPEGLMMPTGERGSAPHLIWTDEPFRVGESTNIELGGCRYRYHCGISRTVTLGDPPTFVSDLAAATVEGMIAALDVARAGTTCEEVEATYQRTIGKYGYAKASRIGYSIGIGYPGMDWADFTVSLKPGDRTPLEPNMTLHLMLGMWQEGWGLVLSETFRVTESGPPETFSSIPRQLFVNR